jgi:hypothetical protein
VWRERATSRLGPSRQQGRVVPSSISTAHLDVCHHAQLLDGPQHVTLPDLVTLLEGRGAGAGARCWLRVPTR